MRALLFVAACGLLAASSAFGRSVSERTGINSALGISPSTQDFVTQAAVSDMFEIASSKLAQEKADEKSKAFAAKMIADHEVVSAELKTLVQAGSVKAELPTAMDKAHQDKLAQLQPLTGADFDKSYDDAQVAAHKDAVDLFDRYASGGDNDALKQIAAKHLPHLREHLRMAEELKK